MRIEEVLPLSELKPQLGISWSESDLELYNAERAAMGRIIGVIGCDPLQSLQDNDPFRVSKLAQVKMAVIHIIREFVYGTQPSRSVNAPSPSTQALRELQTTFKTR